MTHIFIGHSLGAARANANGAHAIAAGLSPAGFFKWGEPNTGWGRFNDLLRRVPQEMSPSWRNETSTGHDEVTDEPPHAPPLLPYAPPWPRHLVSEEPPPFDGIDLFRYHHAELYRRAMVKLDPMPTIAGVTALQAIDLVIAQYAGDVADWDHHDDGSDDGIVWGIKIINGTKCFVYRGSKTPGDFMKDATFPWWNDRDVGPAMIGFILGVHATWEEAKTFL